MTDAQTLRYRPRLERADAANHLLAFIALTGRRFFDHRLHWGSREPRESGAVSRFEVNASGRVYFVDGYAGARIATLHPKSSWRGFSEGGTLRQLVERLSEFIMWDRPIPAHILGPWPDWVCGGDPWGYGDDMDAVRAVARALGLVEVPEADDTEAETPETAPAEVAE